MTNNVVVTSACWGIGYASVHGGKIINNTVVDDGTDVGRKTQPGKSCVARRSPSATRPIEGSPSNDVIIRNNIANGLSIYNVNPNMTMDHNICLTHRREMPDRHLCERQAELGRRTSQAIYGDHNIIDGRGAGGMFVEF